MKIRVLRIVGNVIKNTFIGIGISAYALAVVNFAAQYEIKKDIKLYVDENLVEIMDAQEKKFDIDHFGTPKITYINFPLGSLFLEQSAMYLQVDDSIQIYPGKVFLKEKDSSANKIITYISLFNIDIKECLDHELGHFYIDKLSEEIGENKDFSNFYNRLKNKGLILVDEGVGKYFEIEMNNKEYEFEDWPETIEEFSNKIVQYKAGYRLVKPIIDEHGKSGIEYLIKNPPKNNELMNLPEYQQKALDYLSEE